MRPVEAGTFEVLAFLRRVLPAPPLRVLEVGCGRGELAAMLRPPRRRAVHAGTPARRERMERRELAALGIRAAARREW